MNLRIMTQWFKVPCTVNSFPNRFMIDNAACTKVNGQTGPVFDAMLKDFLLHLAHDGDADRTGFFINRNGKRRILFR